MPHDTPVKVVTELQKAIEELVRFAITRHQAGDILGAQALYGKALDLLPTHPIALHNLGLIYLERGEVESALLLLGEAAKQRPDEAAFQYSLALALQQNGNLPQSLQHYDQALKARPEYREAWENRGVVLQDMEQFDAAIDSYRQALMLYSHAKIASRNLGNALRVVGKLEEALAQYRNLIDFAPLNAEVLFSIGSTLITKGDFAQGWPLYEWRFLSPDFLERNPPYRVPLPRWDGCKREGNSLLVYGEQGIGDEIMFASCLNDLTDQVSKVAVLCQPRLVRLFRRSFPKIHFISKSGDHPQPDRVDDWMADACIAIGSLPQYFRLSEQSFPGSPFLLSDCQTTEAWYARLNNLGKGLKIGISWRGGAEARAINARSIDLQRFSPLFTQSDLIFINVQYGCHSDEIEAFNQMGTKPLVIFPEIDPLQDMDGFASLLSALDLLITVDNSTAHLAGALGVTTWLLLPGHADWRWLKGRGTTPWYRSLRIFWQREHINAAWDEVIARLSSELEQFSRGSRETTENIKTDQRPIEAPLITRATDSKPVALLLNDTSYWYHWGCTVTSLALHEGLRSHGYWVDSIPITTFNKLSPLPQSIDDFDSRDFFQRFIDANPSLVEQIRHSDVVIINGEGTLHGISRTPIALLYTAYLAKRWLNKNTQIINHSCYPDPEVKTEPPSVAEQIYKLVYGSLDFIAIRENLSVQALGGLGIQSVESFDCLPLFLEHHGFMKSSIDQSQKRVVMAGSVSLTPHVIDSMAAIANTVIKYGHKLQILVGANAYLASDDIQFVNAIHPKLKGKYSLVTTCSESAWLNTISGASLLISGRFHHTIAAACLGTPLAVTSSNTQKIKGLINRLQLLPSSVWLDSSDKAQSSEKIRTLLEYPQTGLVEINVIAQLQELAEKNFAGLPIPSSESPMW